ncbi:DUF1150 family protein [Thalassospira sp.]|uniref:DUF1150 family protein n=1 Tax=Thalassospira sp. TaxID=1912094 RepID=UPI002733DA53|nr:DUF1150 family protein [Thalassospira sp.]MDP2700420.1 DUF1150 family protein [Thalassospira sp.]
MTDRITDYDDSDDAMFADEDLHRLSAGDFAMLGIQDFAYVRELVDDSAKHGYGVFTADGTHIATFDSYAVAFAAIRQHDMEPRAVH